MDDEPEIANAVGRFLALFTSIESHLPAMLATLTGMDRSTSEHLLSVSTDFGRRLAMVDTARLAANLNEGKQAFFDEVLSEIKNLQKRRNLYCHGLYQTTGIPGEIRMSSYRFDFRNTAEEVITIQTLNKDCELAERLNLALWKFYEDTSHERRPLRGKGL